MSYWTSKWLNVENFPVDLTYGLIDNWNLLGFKLIPNSMEILFLSSRLSFEMFLEQTWTITMNISQSFEHFSFNYLKNSKQYSQNTEKFYSLPHTETLTKKYVNHHRNYLKDREPFSRTISSSLLYYSDA